MTLSLSGLGSGNTRVDETRLRNDASVIARLWQRNRPIAIAVPILLAISCLMWLPHRSTSIRPLRAADWLELTCVGALGPLAAFISALLVSRRWPLFDGSIWRSLGAHATAQIAPIVVQGIAERLFIPRSPIPFALSSGPILIGNEFGLYAIMLFLIEGFRALRNARRDAQSRAVARDALVEAGRKRAEAELRALKAELNPHFLGNALQSVKALMRTDIDAANDVLVPLGDVLRDALSRATLDETTLREELASLDQFVEIERARLRGHLDVQFNIDIDALGVLVPDLILQPLLENAVKHGLVPFGGGTVRISAGRVNDAPNTLRITVEDDGVALGAVGTTRASDRGGVGLANIRARLAELYGNAGTLELRRGGLGTCAIVDIPWHDGEIGQGESASSTDEDPEQDARDVAVVRSFRAESWRGRMRRIGIVLVAIYSWYLFAQLMIHLTMTISFAIGVEDKLGYAIVDGAVTSALFFLALFVAVRVARHWQLVIIPDKTRRAVWLPFVIGGVATLVTSLCIVASRLGLLFAFNYDKVVVAYHLKIHVFSFFVMGVVTFSVAWCVAQGYFATLRRRRARARRLRLDEQLEAARRRRAHAELRALKSELNPHFIGNAFTAVSVLMRSDPPAASRIIDKLSDLLRAAVDRAGTQEVTLREELDSLEPFLDVERLRLGRELAVSLNIDEDALGTPVPHMILQPLVENAVKHGFAGPTGGRIEVGAHRTSRFLELTIRDDGLGLDGARISPATSGFRREGTGLTNTRARLTKLYGPSATLELAARPEGGAVARVMIPCRDAERA